MICYLGIGRVSRHRLLGSDRRLLTISLRLAMRERTIVGEAVRRPKATSIATHAISPIATHVVTSVATNAVTFVATLAGTFFIATLAETSVVTLAIRPHSSHASKWSPATKRSKMSHVTRHTKS